MSRSDTEPGPPVEGATSLTRATQAGPDVQHRCHHLTRTPLSKWARQAPTDPLSLSCCPSASRGCTLGRPRPSPLNEFPTDIQRFYPAFSTDDAARSEFGFLILRGAETVGVVLARDVGDGSAQVDLDYVVPRYQGFTLGEFVYRSGGPLATLGYRRAIAPPSMVNAGSYWTDVGFRREGNDMVRDLVN
jgi:hypothetical protein